MRILILGATGMLGHAVHRIFSIEKNCEVWGTIRNLSDLKYFLPENQSRIVQLEEATEIDKLFAIVNKIRPNVIINCIGLIKQYAESKDPLIVLPINALLPHYLLKVAKTIKAKLILISTDCVFSGKKGNYLEDDIPDAMDLYGRSKLLGEVNDDPDTITIRTSIIGHELNSKISLIDWFLSQKNNVYGYRNAIFSGLPTIELATILRDHIVPNSKLFGLYHVAANPINKFDLLTLVAKIYHKKIKIIPDDSLIINRSLKADRFNHDAKYVPPEWPSLIEKMYELYQFTGVSHV